MRITVVGQDIFKVVEEKFKLAGFNNATQVNRSMLGNLKILTYSVDIDEIDAVERRKAIVRSMSDDIRLMPMYVVGDWMRIFVFKPIADYK